MSSGWAAVVVASSALGGGALGAVVHLTSRWARVEVRLGELADALREDRKATNERLTWLERHAYNGRHAGQ